MQTIKIEGDLLAHQMKMALVVGRFNSFFTEKLVDGAIDCFVRHGGQINDLTLVKVPGGFEIPLAAKKLAQIKKFDAIVCLGAIIRGSTPHFDYISSEVTKGIAHTSLEYSLPISFGVLTLDTLEQGIERAGTKSGNKGDEAMSAAIEMANLFKNKIFNPKK